VPRQCLDEPAPSCAIISAAGLVSESRLAPREVAGGDPGSRARRRPDSVSRRHPWHCVHEVRVLTGRGRPVPVPLLEGDPSHDVKYPAFCGTRPSRSAHARILGPQPQAASPRPGPARTRQRDSICNTRAASNPLFTDLRVGRRSLAARAGPRRPIPAAITAGMDVEQPAARYFAAVAPRTSPARPSGVRVPAGPCTSQHGKSAGIASIQSRSRTVIRFTTARPGAAAIVPEVPRRWDKSFGGRPAAIRQPESAGALIRSCPAPPTRRRSNHRGLPRPSGPRLAGTCSSGLF